MKLRPLVALAVALAVAPTALAEPAKVGYPSSIASTGDSITRAFNTGWFPYVDWPSNSWATGTSSTVNSHYRRILAANASISGRAYNDAASGADMADLSGQVSRAVGQRAEYVTILMGANDVCERSEAAMTPVATFRAQLDAALQALSAGLPDARIYVVSIPDVYRLWAVYRDSFSARLVWDVADICQSMLANAGSNAQADVDRRNRVRQRNVDYNTQLAQGCAALIHCRFDGNAVFNTDFLRSDVTTRDYFHPSVAGQTKLASVSWSATFGFSDAVAPVSTASLGAGGSVTLTASDNVGVAGIEYRLGNGAFTRYTAPVPLAAGATLTYRAVDVNGNVEATKTMTG
ncbi:MAG: GDSL-type esterase/lipase family protein [Gaiellaceae bacterium]